MPETEKEFWDRLHGVIVHSSKECVAYNIADRIQSDFDAMTCKICLSKIGM